MMENHKDLSLRQDVGFLLSRASGLVARTATAALAGHGLRIRQFSVLTLAAEAADGLSQRELAAVLGLDPSQVVLLVDELADAGLVERRSPPADRRTRLVVATAAGRRVQGEAARSARSSVADQLSALSAAEHETLTALLARIVEADRAGT
jgi:DNA-binding MarR family transcriptional regulator